LIQNNLDGREGTAMLGRDKEGDAVVDCRHHTNRTRRSSQPSLKLQPNTPKPKRVFEVGRGVGSRIYNANKFVFRDTKDPRGKQMVSRTT